MEILGGNRISGIVFLVLRGRFLPMGFPFAGLEPIIRHYGQMMILSRGVSISNCILLAANSWVHDIIILPVCCREKWNMSGILLRTFDLTIASYLAGESVSAGAILY